MENSFLMCGDTRTGAECSSVLLQYKSATQGTMPYVLQLAKKNPSFFGDDKGFVGMTNSLTFAAFKQRLWTVVYGLSAKQ